MQARLLTVDQAARALGVSRATLWRRLQAGAIESVRIGGRRRIPARALRAPATPEPRPFTIENPIFGLIGIARGRGPGWSSDKHRHPV